MNRRESATHLVGVDIGGTFTDIVLVSSGGGVRTCKVDSTADDYCDGIVRGVVELLATAGLDPADVAGLVHGTTVATNTILEGRGVRVGLITTEGFRDVLEMRRWGIPTMYDLQYTPPRPLAPRRLRVEIDERIGPRGQIWRELDEASAERAADRLAAARVESVAISLIHSYANPAHERRVGEIVAARMGRRPYITLSSDILPEIREYERTSTTVVNAYIGPIVEHYLSTLTDRLSTMGLRAPVRIMQSNGGVMAVQAAIAKPACIIESGPAAGVIAAAAMARRIGAANVISLDMGGTTAKAALIEDGEPARTTEFEVGAGINLSSKLVKGGGHAVKLPFIDISEIGAGGGSIIAVDGVGALKVGPRSAGARPGPACYGLGGTEPTFTDAMVVLGFVNPRGIAGGRVRLHPELAHRAIATFVAKPLGVAPTAAAWGAYAVAAASMTRAVKAVSTYRGRDPRDFALMAFGGNGPIAAVEIARALRMSRVIVPAAPGVFSAFGLLCADIEYVSGRTVMRRLGEIDGDDVRTALGALEAQARAILAGDGVAGADMAVRHVAELRYAGQAYELGVPIDPVHPDLAAVAAAFDAEHARTYGHASPGAPTDLVGLKVTASAATGLDAGVLATLSKAPASAAGPRDAYFGPRFGARETPVIDRARLASGPWQGPVIIEEDDATCVVPPDATVALDQFGNIDIRVG